MAATDHPDPSAVRMTPVLEGEKISKQVEGGFIRSQVPAGGIVFEHLDSTFFVSAVNLRAVLDALAERERDQLRVVDDEGDVA